MVGCGGWRVMRGLYFFVVLPLCNYWFHVSSSMRCELLCAPRPSDLDHLTSWCVITSQDLPGCTVGFDECHFELGA
jgi:hypothetical protein